MELEISVEDLLNKRKIESDRIEFKAGWNPDDIYHSVCAFANDYNNDGGGYIAVGVEEKNGVAVRPVKGIPEYMLDEIQNTLPMCLTTTTPMGIWCCMWPPVPDAPAPPACV